MSIKIPSTPEALLACREVEKEGIRTLATSLFSVPQALAAQEAGCLYIAPWLNRESAVSCVSFTVDFEILVS